jgi:hypothetical protein
MDNGSDAVETRNVTLQSNGIVRDEDGYIIGRMNRSIERDEIVAAVAQAWCTKENEHKEMDAVLAEAIVMNVWNLFQEKPNEQG